MKKTFSFICVLMVVAMIMAVPAFAAGVSEAPYASLGQDLYVTGADYAPKAIEIDGVISDGEGWVKVTPDGGADLNVVTSTMNKAKSSKVLAFENKYDTQLDKSPKIEYYVAQDNDYVYFAMEYSDNSAIYKFIKEEAKSQFLTYVRLGFNANDYTQQLCLYSDGHYITQGTASGAYPTWTRTPLRVRGIADNNKYVEKTDAEAGVVEKEHIDSRMKVEIKAVYGGKWNVRTYEVKMSKNAIVDLYKKTFGNADGVDFNTMYVGVSSSDYAWRNGAADVDYNVVHGTVLDEATATANGVNSFLPDMIYFGELAAETVAPATDAPTGDSNAPAGDVEDKPLDEGEIDNSEPIVTTGSSCGGAVSFAGIALVAALGTCTAFVAKKKEN